MALPLAALGSIVVAKVVSRKVLGTSKDVLVEGGALSKEIFGFDFVLFFIKLVLYFTVALVIDKIHFLIVGTANIAGTLLLAIGIKLPTEEPEFLQKLFSDEGFNGLQYWDLVKYGAIVLTILEFFMYYNNLKKQGGKPSPFTIAIFGLVLVLLTAFTLPDLIEKLKSRLNTEGLQ